MERIEHCSSVALTGFTNTSAHLRSNIVWCTKCRYKRLHSGWDTKEAKAWLKCTDQTVFVSLDSITKAILEAYSSLFTDCNDIVSNLGPGTSVVDSQLYPWTTCMSCILFSYNVIMLYSINMPILLKAELIKGLISDPSISFWAIWLFRMLQPQ